MPYEYIANGKKVSLALDDKLVAVRFREPAPHSMRAEVAARAQVGPLIKRIEVPGEKFTVFEVNRPAQPRNMHVREAARAIDSEPEVARATPVFRVGDTRVIAPDRLVVGFKPKVSHTDDILRQHGCDVLERQGDEYLVALSESEDPFEVAERLTRLQEVDYAEPDFVTLGRHIPKGAHAAPSREAGAAPGPATSGDDPLADRQYALRITKALDAWSLQQGDASIRIAILDEGVEVGHRDLEEAIAGHFDATDNGTGQDPNPWDAHGTCCAGLAGAVAKNEIGVRGIGAGCSIVAVRIAYATQDDQDHWVTKDWWIKNGIDLAWQNGADILSNSWGGGAPSSAITNAFERARTNGRGGKGCIIVIAAGNENGPVSFPGNLPNVLTVSASNEYDEPKTKTSQDGETWWGSNFGPEVSVAAPGVHNYTTDISGESGYNDGNVLDGDYVSNFNGTSSATPIVAGAAGLVLSANGNLNEAQVRQIICATADKVPTVTYVNGHNKKMGYGRLNVLKAVQAAQSM